MTSESVTANGGTREGAMLDSQELKRLADRCYSASQKCFDLSAAAELRIIGDELSAKAIELERQSLPKRPVEGALTEEPL